MLRHCWPKLWTTCYTTLATLATSSLQRGVSSQSSLTHYQVLHVARSASADEVKKAFRQVKCQAFSSAVIAAMTMSAIGLLWWCVIHSTQCTCGSTCHQGLPRAAHLHIMVPHDGTCQAGVLGLAGWKTGCHVNARRLAAHQHVAHCNKAVYVQSNGHGTMVATSFLQ